jgi:hypothetical protein
MIPVLATIERGEPLTFVVARKDAQGQPVAPAAGWVLASSVKPSDGMNTPPASVQPLGALQIADGEGESWLATLSPALSATLAAGTYACDFVVRNGQGAIQIVSDPVAFRVRERITP